MHSSPQDLHQQQLHVAGFLLRIWSLLFIEGAADSLSHDAQLQFLQVDCSSRSTIGGIACSRYHGAVWPRQELCCMEVRPAAQNPEEGPST